MASLEAYAGPLFIPEQLCQHEGIGFPLILASQRSHRDESISKRLLEPIPSALCLERRPLAETRFLRTPGALGDVRGRGLWVHSGDNRGHYPDTSVCEWELQNQRLSRTACLRSELHGRERRLEP